MQQILILGGGAAGLAAALAAAQTAEGRAHITVLDKNAKVGKKLLATGNGRCNLDNRDITPERYFTLSLIHIPSPRDVEESRMPSSA